MNDLERVDDYFAGRMSRDERTRFEATLGTDEALAQTVAFYRTARQAAQTEARDRRHAEWDARRRATRQEAPRSIGRWAYATAAAASVVLLLGLGWFFLDRPTPVQVADAYINEQLARLDGTMDARSDSLQTGIRRYNGGDFAGAGAVFNALLQRDSTNADALKFAGIVSLRTGKYDVAIGQFHRLSQRTDLYANPGLFLEAVARLKRGLPNDKNRSRELLQTVINKNLDGAQEAKKIVKSL